MIIRPIEECDFARAHAMQVTYLDGDDLPAFRIRVEAAPELYLVAMEGETLVGLCYGKVKPKGNAVLNGICADLDNGWGRKGIGSALLRAFEEALRKLGKSGYSVGAADDPKVEAFYMKHGHRPVELVSKDEAGNELARMKVSGYEEGEKARAGLRARCHPREVILIFEKRFSRGSS